MIERAVAGYYARALAAHGTTARGVDWSSREGQERRFEVLLEVVEFEPRPSLLDYGCGYGALAAYLDAHDLRCDYVGFDISAEMVAAARAANPGHVFVDAAEAPADYVLASGIFNVKLDTPGAVWDRYVDATLERLAGLATRALAFNMLPPADPPERARPDLHYADPEVIAARCRAFGEVSVRDDYGLWEYTVTVRR